MKKICTGFLFSILILLTSTPFVYAQDFPGQIVDQQQATSSSYLDSNYAFPKDEYYTANVISIADQGTEEIAGYSQVYQKVLIKLTSGPDKDKTYELKQSQLSGTTTQKLKSGDSVVVTKTQIAGEPTYQITDRYRLQPIVILLIIFFILVIIFGKLKGFTSILGLGASILIIILYIVPQLVNGSNPLVVTLIGLLLIAFTSLYLAHGFNKRTTIALVATLITLSISIILAMLAVNLTQLSGLGSEEAFYLQVGSFGKLNLQGLLLGGILIGTLGVLDDITTSQVAAIDEISKANPNLNFKELYKSGLNLGHEHIASLVNTLFLAYAGTSLPLFLLLTQNSSGQPLWAVLNSEKFVEEIVRTVVGSIALIIGVPISTLLAAYYFSKRNNYKNNDKLLP